MNELWENAQNVDFSDLLRFVVMVLSIYCFSRLWASHRRIAARAGDRLKNFYYSMLATCFTFGTACFEGWLRNRGDNYSLWFMILVLLFMTTAFGVGHPLDFLRGDPGEDPDSKPGFTEYERDHDSDTDA